MSSLDSSLGKTSTQVVHRQNGSVLVLGGTSPSEREGSRSAKTKRKFDARQERDGREGKRDRTYLHPRSSSTSRSSGSSSRCRCSVGSDSSVVERVGCDVGDELLSGEGEESFPEARKVSNEASESVHVFGEGEQESEGGLKERRGEESREEVKEWERERGKDEQARI